MTTPCSREEIPAFWTRCLDGIRMPRHLCNGLDTEEAS